MVSAASPLAAPNRATVDRRVKFIEALYDQYGQVAFTLALRILGDRMAAEDVVQEVLLNVWRGSDRYHDERGSLRSWLLASVHHRCIDRLRGTAGRARRDLPLDLLAETAVGPDTIDAVAQQLQSDTVRSALRALPEEQRQAIELAYFEGLTHRELAARLQVPLGTLKGRLRLGLEKLRALGLQRDAPE